MDNTELHYLAYDPEEMWLEMMAAYSDAGGDILYSGDEKEMLLRAVQAILMQAFAGVDNGLRMGTLRYAQRDYLKLIGEDRGCPYNEAEKATATVQIVFSATGRTDTLAAGEALTADGEMMYLLDDDVIDSGYAQTVSAKVTCAIAGSAGNGLLSGTQMQSIRPHAGVYSIYCVADAAGGQDDEDLEVYRERIRTHGLTSVTTGPQQQYETAAKAVSSEVVDAHAINLGAGEVGVYIIPASSTGVSALLEAVAEALSDKTSRPLTDQVTVLEATAVSYTLNVEYAYDGSGSVQALMVEAVNEYQTWQERSIGRAFNPDKLAALMYQAGATRVLWGSGSVFNGGSVEYTEIQPNQYCKGNISLAVISA